MLFEDTGKCITFCTDLGKIAQDIREIVCRASSISTISKYSQIIAKITQGLD